MNRADDGLLFMWGNIHVILEVQMAICHVPIIHRGAGEQGRTILQVFQGSEYKGVRFSGGLNLLSKGQIEGLDNDGLRADGCFLIVESGVYMVPSGQCICWGHFGSRGHLPLDVKVL